MVKSTKVLSSDYSKYFNASTRDIPLLLFLNILCIPLTKILIILRLKPDTITTLSNVITLLAVLSLLFVQNPFFFPVLWLLGLFFDICDGMVARITKQTSASGSFYDHMSDQFKFILLFLACGLKYADVTIWVLAFVSSTFFLFYAVLNTTLALRRLRLSVSSGLNGKGPHLEGRQNEKSHHPGLLHTLIEFIKKRPTLYKYVRGVKDSVFLMQGNCLLFLLPLSFGLDFASYSMCVFIFITIFNIRSCLKANMKVNYMLSVESISWK